MDESFSNFSKHSIYLPTFFQMGFNSGYPTPIYYNIGENKLIPINSKGIENELIYHVKNKPLNVDVIPEVIPSHSGIMISLHNGIEKAGTYTLTNKDSLIGLLSFNYQRTESNPEYYTSTELTEIIDSLKLKNFSVFNSSMDTFGSDFNKREKGIELWKWFVVFTLLFLAIEIILIRFFKPSIL